MSPVCDGKVEKAGARGSGVAGAPAECVTHQSSEARRSVWIAVFG